MGIVLFRSALNWIESILRKSTQIKIGFELVNVKRSVFACSIPAQYAVRVGSEVAILHLNRRHSQRVPRTQGQLCTVLRMYEQTRHKSQVRIIADELTFIWCNSIRNKACMLISSRVCKTGMIKDRHPSGK